MKEKWIDIRGYEECYQVSNLGRVRRKLKDNEYRVLKGRDNGHGYLSVYLHKDGEGKSMYIHRLVADAFIPNPEGKEQVNHKDGKNKSDNRVNNLEWCTRSENLIHASKNGLLGYQKLSYDDCLYIKRVYKPYDSQFGAVPLSKKYGVTPQTIIRMIKGTRHKYLNDESA